MNESRSSESALAGGMRRFVGSLQRSESPRPPKREVARVIRGAAELALFAKDPHLAARAAWVLLQDRPQADGSESFVAAQRDAPAGDRVP